LDWKSCFSVKANSQWLAIIVIVIVATEAALSWTKGYIVAAGMTMILSKVLLIRLMNFVVLGLNFMQVWVILWFSL